MFNLYVRGGTRGFENKTTGLHNLKTDLYVSNVEVKYLSYDEQLDIVKKLDKLNLLISQRKKQLAKLDLLVKARFVEMFGDPVTNPKGWAVHLLKDLLFSIDNGKSIICDSVARKDYSPAILKLSAVTYGVYNENENKAMIDTDDFDDSIEVKNGDLLFTRKNTPDLVGMSAFVYSTKPKLMMPDLIFRLNCNPICEKIWLWKLINHPDFREQIKNISNGSAKSMSNISKERLCNLKIALPPLKLQKNYVDVVKEVDETKATIQQSLAKLETLKKSLMQEYFG